MMKRHLSVKHFDPVQLVKAARIEMKYTNNKMMALHNAMNHLTKDPNYYRRLRAKAAMLGYSYEAAYADKQLQVVGRTTEDMSKV